MFGLVAWFYVSSHILMYGYAEIHSGWIFVTTSSIVLDMYVLVLLVQDIRVINVYKLHYGGGGGEREKSNLNLWNKKQRT